MTVLPFICLALGYIIGKFFNNNYLSRISETISTLALITLMCAIGIGIGIDRNLVKEFPQIGLNCLIISSCAIVLSVFLTFICEKTVLFLNDYRVAYLNEQDNQATADQSVNGLVWIMPSSILIGLIIGIFCENIISSSVIDKLFTISLVILYICVGIGQGSSKEVLSYLKKLGPKILLLPVSILIGSIVGGIIASYICGLPLFVSVISASGMSFYSITGAYMTQTYGVSIGAYGFLVNVLREFITIITMPVLIRIGKSAPIAGGAAGDMDTMLAPVTKFVGEELGLVTLLTGTILTFIVPFLLPILSSILK